MKQAHVFLLNRLSKRGQNRYCIINKLHGDFTQKVATAQIFKIIQSRRIKCERHNRLHWKRLIRVFGKFADNASSLVFPLGHPVIDDCNEWHNLFVQHGHSQALLLQRAASPIGSVAPTS